MFLAKVVDFMCLFPVVQNKPAGKKGGVMDLFANAKPVGEWHERWYDRFI